MLNEDRRKELGRMLMDVAKYLATIGMISGVLTKTLAFYNGIFMSVLVSLITAIAFFIIPPKKGD